MVRRLTRILGRYVDRAAALRLPRPEIAPTVRPLLDHPRRALLGLVRETRADLRPRRRVAARRDRSATSRVQRIGRDEILRPPRARHRHPVGTQLPEGDGGGARDRVRGRSAVRRSRRCRPLDEPTTAARTHADERRGERRTDEEPPRRGAGRARTGRARRGPRPEDVLLLGSTPRAAPSSGSSADSTRRPRRRLRRRRHERRLRVRRSGIRQELHRRQPHRGRSDPSARRSTGSRTRSACVVFHYSRNETYLPEFAAMAEPNDDPTAVDVARERLRCRAPWRRRTCGSSSRRRCRPSARASSPGLTSIRSCLATGELTLNDWKLLMGVEGGDQLYVKAMTNDLPRAARRHLARLRSERRSRRARSSPQQKNIAETTHPVRRGVRRGPSAVPPSTSSRGGC